MRLHALGIGTALAVGAGMVIASAQTAPPTVDGLVSAAKVAAGTDWSGTFMRLCIPPPSAPPAARGGANAARRSPPPRETWHVEPAKVADNLYFLGEKAHHSWAIVGSEGIILIEALYDYMVADEVVGGMRKLGLDTNKVKYAVMSHAHGDHDGGAAFLQDSIPGMRLVYGAEDWDAVEKSTNRPGGKPKRDMVGMDGQRLSVGDASIQIVTMPGHTAGTLSYLFEVKDNGKPLRVAYVGGTAIPFNGTPAYYDQYLASSQKLAKAAAAYGATVLLSNHTEFDNGYYKAHTAAFRKPGEPNPFDVGQSGVARYFTVVQNCTMAAKLRAARM
ncbi:MAG: MBL fold metallo-hydrolase [Acidobacteria bacterium]|nr:MAG: MBL fold metallo-hydrolase [Acidobacteriota bacterium]